MLRFTLRAGSVICAVLVLLVSVRPAAAQLAPSSALKAYVAKPDASYAWTKRREGTVGGVKYAELILTSQTWRDIVWRHQLLILVPEKVETPEHALLLISGGGWKDSLAEPPKADEPLAEETAVLATACKRAGAPVVLLSQVPQQPIFGGMVEDEIISYTFEQYLKTGDLEWPLLLPMAKSAVRAMDATQEFANAELGTTIKSFTVTGASKRGWTTWLTGAVDPRATAIAPMVIDMLNTPAQMKHQLATWGEFSEQIEDYTRRGIQSSEGTEGGQRLNTIVDPYSYRATLTQPKLLIFGTNDRYWPLDACNLYWNDLQGDKYLLYVPNNGHGLNDFQRLLGSITALHKMNAGKLEFPKFAWNFDENADRLLLTTTSNQKPKKMVAWTCTAPTRDVREAKWSQQPMTESEAGWSFELPTPKEGYAATFAEGVYDAGGMPYYLSSNVRIIKAPGAPEAKVGGGN
ncbi:MAG: PhoPQ-activated pathogenicity-related family protein [Pirellulales bacterium]|nr:PhoPQ-activated pathogenicity-related family protein [Pirellulales bacterium]